MFLKIHLYNWNQTKNISFVETIGGPKMSGNFVRERQRINFQTFLGRLCWNLLFKKMKPILHRLIAIEKQDKVQ